MTIDDAAPPTDLTRRAGRYVQQPTGYRAYIPEPLPPNPPIRYDNDGELQRLLSDADRDLARLGESILAQAQTSAPAGAS